MLRTAIDAAPVLGNPTGVGVFTRSLINALARQGDVDVIAYALSGRGAAQLKDALPDGVAHSDIPMPARLLLEVWKRFDRPVAEHWTKSVDVVHGTNFVVPPTRNAGAVVTIHDLTSIRFPELCTPTTLQYPTLIKRAIAKGAHVHVLTKTIGDEVKNNFAIDPVNVHVVAPGVTPLTMSTSSQGTAPYILALGTIEPRKDYPLLVRAFDKIASKHPDLRLVIAGARGWGAADLDAAIAQAKSQNRIECLGWVDDVGRAQLLQNASVLAYPSIYEGFGLPPLEAMSAGVPVVATAVDAVIEVSGVAVLLAPLGDANAFAEQLHLAITNDAERRRLVAAGHARVGDFSWAKTATEMADLYALVAKERS